MMGYASFRVWDEGDGLSGKARFPITIYIVHLIINFSWTPVFFYFHAIGFALIHILILWLMIILTGILFYKVDKVAGYLIIPYFLWVSFATFLTLTIWQLN